MLDIIEKANFFSKEETSELYNFLITHCQFEEKTVLNEGNTTKVPRLIQWYGPYEYSYSGITNPAIELPKALQQVAQKIVMFLKEQGFEAQFNSVLINYYRDGKDKIGMHGDDETQLGAFPIIASVSLGDSRVFKMRNNVTKEKINFLLEDGHLFIMKGNTQNEWMHGIDSEPNKGVRINLTFRMIKYPPKKIIA